MSYKNVGELNNKDALDLIAKMIDLADIQEKPEATLRALKLCDELRERELDDKETCLLHYFTANAWASERKIKHKDTDSAWAWEQPEILKELVHLRTAIRSSGFKQLDKVRRCQILTNAANLLNTLGRCTDAIEYWNRALEIIPNFSMSLGNRGYGFMSYARTLHDQGHAITMMKFAHDDLRQATASGAFFDSPGHDEIKKNMVKAADEIALHIDLKKIGASLKLDGFSLGRSKKEREYRRWCLDHRLFLNPLNDLGPHAIAANDVLMLPNMVSNSNNPPREIAFYNQLKQEYVSARYMNYESIKSDRPHFSDRGVLLYDTLDYPAYSLSIERMKTAYCMTYSLFDKLAFFINTYWKLEINEKSINFRSVWHSPQNKGQPRALRNCFHDYENWPLRGLYWLSKDLLENDAELADTMEPDAEALKTMRNHLEHKFLKVHIWPWTTDQYAGITDDVLHDSTRYSVTRGDLEAKTLRLLKLARAGLLYLSLAVHREEYLRAKQRNDERVLPMELFTLPDNLKQ